MEPLTIIALASGISSLVVSILTHIKVSKCYGVEIATHTPPPTFKSPLIG